MRKKYCKISKDRFKDERKDESGEKIPTKINKERRPHKITVILIGKT